MLTSLIDLKNVGTKEIMIPIEKVFKLNYDDTLDETKCKHIEIKNYSKIPVYNG